MGDWPRLRVGGVFVESVVCRGEWKLIWVRLRYSEMGLLVMDGWWCIGRGKGSYYFE